MLLMNFYKNMSPKKTNPHHSAQQAFYYLTSFFALALVAAGLGTLLYELIEYYFPQQTGYGGFSQGAVKFGISSLIIAAPIYYFFTRYINRSLSKKDLDLDSGVRRWLTYVVMFVAVAVTLGDLIAILNEFLDGTITIRFLLKALTIFAISGSIFLYYFLDMNNATDASRRNKNALWGILFWLAILVPLVWAFTIFESPSEARLRHADEQIVNQLQNIRNGVENYAANNNRLPANIDSLLEKPEQYGYGIDMALLQQNGFEYQPVSGREYELCAMFERDTVDKKSPNEYTDLYSEWKHPLGRHCFSFEIAQSVLDGTTYPNEKFDYETMPATFPDELAPPPIIAPMETDAAAIESLPQITDAPPPPASPPTTEGLESVPVE